MNNKYWCKNLISKIENKKLIEMIKYDKKFIFNINNIIKREGKLYVTHKPGTYYACCNDYLYSKIKLSNYSFSQFISEEVIDIFYENHKLAFIGLSNSFYNTKEQVKKEDIRSVPVKFYQYISPYIFLYRFNRRINISWNEYSYDFFEYIRSSSGDSRLYYLINMRDYIPIIEDEQYYE